MSLDNRFQVFEDIIEEMSYVYKHDNRPWLIGYSGGKDSSLLVSLVVETVLRLPEHERTKKIFIVTSDTGVENPVVKRYMHTSSQKINEFSSRFSANIRADIIYPDVAQSYWSLVIGLGYPTPEPPGFRWCTERLKILPMNRYTNSIIEKHGEMLLNHIYKGRTAGGGHLLSLLMGLRPLLRLIGRSHITAEAYLNHIRKADLL